MTNNARLILPPCDFADDEELLTWLETCRLVGIKASDEVDEAAAFVFAKLRRYAESQGMDRGPARRTARSVALPIARSADSMTRFAGYMRLAARRFEAYVEAVERPRRRDVDFKIKGQNR